MHALAWGEEDRPLLLLLHGFPEHSGAWEEVASRLADRWFCVAPDQRGYGRSPRPRGAEHYAMRALVADAMAAIRRFGGGRAAVVGHDWGAAVAYAVAVRAPEAVSALVCLNGVHPGAFQDRLLDDPAQARASRYITRLRAPGSEEALAAGGFARLMGLFGADMDLSWLTPERRREYEAAWGGADGLGAMIDWYRASPVVVPGEDGPAAERPRWDPARMRVAMPHLVIWGMGDTAFVPELRRGAEPHSDHFELEEVEGADHWVLHQAPDRVAERIAAFVG